jgi:uncharacterized protein (DUF2126 family)
MIHVSLEHRTSYQFDRAVRLLPHVVRLRPAPHCRTPVLAYSLKVEPDGHFINWQQDPFGNYLARLVFPEPARHLTITVDLVADMTVINPFDFFVEESARCYPFAYEADLAAQLGPYLQTETAGPLMTALLAGIRADIERAGAQEPVPLNDFLVHLNQRTYSEVSYSVRMDPGVYTPEETLAKGIGSCRDTAWLLVRLLRHFGLAARFVSGYLVQLVADTAPLEGPAGPAGDFTDLHAWAEVYVPGAGWLGLDPTSGLFAGEGHLPLVCTPDPASAAPVTGAVEPCGVTFEHSNRVRRVHETARVTKPYTEDGWSRIDALGRQVDDDLVASDVRLTIGGEPTFVSVDAPNEPEWRTDADGDHKRAVGWEYMRRLAKRFAPGGLIQSVQGKWYPGEELPRWQRNLYWRTDGRPIWKHPALLASPVAADQPVDDPAAQPDAYPDEARRLLVAIAGRLGIPAELCLPAYEDPVHLLWDEASLPPGPPPHGEQRAALVERLDTGEFAEPAGWVVPLHRPPAGDIWGTSRWTTRRRHLFLTPGDSPMGLRLPLSSLEWRPGESEPPRSTFDSPEPLRDAGEATPPDKAVIVRCTDAPPTALCVEPRHGRLHVFMPPLEQLDWWLGLVEAVERAVAATGASVAIEGYPPPADPRIRMISVAPDPGVLEVNLHPSGSWPELVQTIEGVYEDARVSRLAAEKFDLDGTHTGTGGGNHITLGGPTPADSPMLRRPDLLQSLITYWQHHPSLSYLFSGLFVGPTSQAPRVDEARQDSLDEMEIAFAELDRLGDRPRPWAVDRLLRNLLVDVTGNTHRAEFCIDKLFSPSGERGRLGLVEMRGFEMPPHPKMALVQALLVRALIARCWRHPYRLPLVRWGLDLHDRFLLPAFVAADVAEIATDLAAHGYPFEVAWLDPFMEFRFPVLGSVEVGPARIELRRAIEPWPVLGEEGSVGGTSRGVDSSLERMQVQVDGMIEGRHAVTCNGRPLPLQSAGVPGRYVAGVRYKAWKPPSSLHPTIGIHSPLVFDLFDLWNDRPIGGCTYHVVHPGGRAERRFPVNSNEAEARRAGRFQPFGHTPGSVCPPPGGIVAPAGGPGYPRTLDLRRQPFP